MKKISPHISYFEATHSDTAKRLGLDNHPSKAQLENMQALAHHIFEPLRRFVGGPIRINSFFRSEAVNKAIGGSEHSAHMEGLAIDLDDVYGYASNKMMFEWLLNNVFFDQLIWEFGTDQNPAWVHVGFNPSKNRGEVLRAIRSEEEGIIYNRLS